MHRSIAEVNLESLREAGAILADSPEEALVAMAQAGNEGAFQELVRRTRGTCLCLANCILRNRDDADDEVQRAFWQAYSHLDTFGNQAKFSTWVGRIVINNCYMALRQTKRMRLVPYERVSPDGDVYFVHGPIDRQTPENELSSHQISTLVRFELDRLPSLLRLPLEFQYFNSMSVSEIADQLGISVSATKSRLHRAHLYLRDRMSRHVGVRGPGTLM